MKLLTSQVSISLSMEAWRRSDRDTLPWLALQLRQTWDLKLPLSHQIGEHISYAIVGSGKIGQALARAFARKNIEVIVASRRSPEALAPQAQAIGPTVTAKSLREALEADTIS